MDEVALIVNVGIFVATAGAATVAWWQAIEAGHRRTEAQKASDNAAELHRRAAEAQQDAARALESANEIAKSAQQSVDEQLTLERRREARLTEHRDVQWSGGWVSDTDGETPITMELTNIGTTDAAGVTLTIDMPQGRQAFRLGNVAAGSSAQAQIRDTHMKGPAGAALIARRDIAIEVHWVSPAGQPELVRGTVWAE